jgi:endo-1,4-beta-xylanase
MLASGCLAMGTAVAGPPIPQPPERRALREVGASKGLIVGSAMSVEELNPDDERLFAREVASITPENALKMSAIRPAPSAWNFAAADALIAFASRNGLAVRGHALIWNNDRQPAWLDKLSAGEMRSAMHEHIERTMTRYASRVGVWDVVNEPVGEVVREGYGLRDGPFLARLGIDYIAESFRLARKAAPEAKLVLNETHTERDDRFGLHFRRNLLLILDRLLDQGIPIDGVGLQGHLQSSVRFDIDAYVEFLGEIERRKLFLEITELDINDDAYPDDEARRDAEVAAAYRRYLTGVLTLRNLRSLTFWQLGDRSSWYFSNSVHQSPSSRRRPRPLLFDLRMRPKPALVAVLESLDRMQGEYR